MLIIALVLKATGLSPGLRNIYAKVQVNDVVQRTDTVRDASESWNECLPMCVLTKLVASLSTITDLHLNRRVPSGRTIVSLSLMRRISASPYYQAVGTREIAMSDLAALCNGREGASP